MKEFIIKADTLTDVRGMITALRIVNWEGGIKILLTDKLKKEADTYIIKDGRIPPELKEMFGIDVITKNYLLNNNN